MKLDKQQLNKDILAVFGNVKGIVDACNVLDSDRRIILDIELEAESKSLMGLGKVINSGVRSVLECEMIYAALTDMNFDPGKAPALIVRKGDEIVGEEIRDKERIDQLSGRKDVWFLHRNFVFYKDKISFPQDIVQKICVFETPCIPAEWCVLDDHFRGVTILSSNPVMPCDVYLKKQYFRGVDSKGLGTILVGVQSST